MVENGRESWNAGRAPIPVDLVVAPKWDHYVAYSMAGMSMQNFDLSVYGHIAIKSNDEVQFGPQIACIEQKRYFFDWIENMMATKSHTDTIGIFFIVPLIKQQNPIRWRTSIKTTTLK